MKVFLFLAVAGTALAFSPGPTGMRTYAEGVNAPAHQRAQKEKLVWAYTGAVTQGEAESIYNAHGAPTVDDLLNTPINHIAFIANVNVQNATGWWAPGANNTGGCGQDQTYELPFGYDGRNASTEAKSLPEFHKNLERLHSNGVTVTLTLGSWCTQLPINASEEWKDSDFDDFVKTFETVREKQFGGMLDGIDFDWEGYCDAGCLKGTCQCGWNDKICGTATPAQLASGITWMESPAPGQPPMKHQCWIMPTSSTFQVMTGIAHAMKKAKYVVTLVPMSTSMYSGEADTSKNQVMRNEYVKYRHQNSLGADVDLLDLADGILLQWYSGFDAALCSNTGNVKDCQCNNVPDKDYPNVLNNTRDAGGNLMATWQTYWNVSGNMFPNSYPVRCQACGKNVILPNGTRGDLPCHQEDEGWYVPSQNRSDKGANPPAVVKDHNSKMEEYANGGKGQSAAGKKRVPQWWVQGQSVNSKCPRSIDCPDFQYGTEPRYSRQVALLKSLQKVVDLGKISIGFETLGVDVTVQMEAWEDHGLPWTTAPLKAHKPPMPYTNYTYYKKCTQNMTTENYKENKRCAMPLLYQQWGPKFSAKDIVGLEKAVQQQLGAELAGIGMFTLDGCLSQPANETRRFWFDELMKLNETYKIPCYGKNCGSRGKDPWTPGPKPPTPPTPSGDHGDYTVKAGDSCWAIADSKCSDGTKWQKTICNADSTCKNLQTGAKIKYDCSGSGKYCS